MYCSKCGKENPHNARFCRKCGNELTKEKQVNTTNSNSVLEQRPEKAKINNGSVADWLGPLLYWYNPVKNEYKLAKTKVIAIITFFSLSIFFITTDFVTPFLAAVLTIITSILVFLYGWTAHLLLNRRR